MNGKNAIDRNEPLYLGVDGGQSHTEALVADARGRILGRGLGGASNHAEQPGGRERLRTAVLTSVAEALGLDRAALACIPREFAAAHCGMTGGAIYKEEIIAEILTARCLSVGHDAPTALRGATAGRPGIVVIAGTGSVVYGENAAGEAARASGLGYLFSDEGSGFWLAAETMRLAVKEQDGVIAPAGLVPLVLSFFAARELREVTDAFYNEKLGRDRFAQLARRAADAAAGGNQTLGAAIEKGAAALVENVAAVAGRLRFAESFAVAGVGGMFGGALLRENFARRLAETLPAAVFTAPRFGPAVGALIVAYRRSGVEISADLLENLEKTQIK